MATQRFGFIDWYRGLACVLMFQTHAYDAWTAEPYRNGYWWWLARQFLGGFPARMFLLLTGVSLMLRFAGDRRRGKSDQVARRGALWRGFEVFLVGYGFRVVEWIIGGARPAAAWALLKFDVLQCIGVSLMLAALVASPRDTEPGRFPLRPLFFALLVALTTPLLQALGRPAPLPAWLCLVLWGQHDLVPFPIFPWVSYTLGGCVVGAYFVRGAAANKLGRTLLITALLGAVMAVAGKIGGRIDIPIYRPTLAVPIPATPVSYFFRTGTCVFGLAMAYFLDRLFAAKASSPAAAPAQTSLWTRLAQLSPLLWLGQASMTVYMVHIDLVYNMWSYPIKHKLGPVTASVLLAVLTVAMVWLSWYRTVRPTLVRARPVLSGVTAASLRLTARN